MDTERAAVYGVVGLVLVTTLASGPLVGAVDLTTAPEKPSYGTGNATVGEVTLPAEAEITAGRYGSGEYYLDVPDARIDLVDVSGDPVLAYHVSIRSVGYSRTTNHFVTASEVGTYDLSLDRTEIGPSMAENRRYDGTLAVFLRSNGTERRLAERNITIEVTE